MKRWITAVLLGLLLALGAMLVGSDQARASTQECTSEPSIVDDTAVTLNGVGTVGVDQRVTSGPRNEASLWWCLVLPGQGIDIVGGFGYSDHDERHGVTVAPWNCVATPVHSMPCGSLGLGGTVELTLPTTSADLGGATVTTGPDCVVVSGAGTCSSAATTTAGVTVTQTGTVLTVPDIGSSGGTCAAGVCANGRLATGLGTVTVTVDAGVVPAETETVGPGSHCVVAFDGNPCSP